MSVDQTSFSKKYVGQMCINQLSVDNMSLNQMSVDQMPVDQMYVGQMIIDRTAPSHKKRTLMVGLTKVVHNVIKTFLCVIDVLYNTSTPRVIILEKFEADKHTSLFMLNKAIPLTLKKLQHTGQLSQWHNIYRTPLSTIITENNQKNHTQQNNP
jgi:hypothetical protein